MDITIFTMAYNEEIMLPYFFKHYKSSFPTAKFVYYDNQSTDNSRQVALDNGAEIIEWDTNGLIDDEKMRDLKNNCWKTHRNWILVADPDELLQISEKELEEEEKSGVSIITSCGYNMVNMENNLDLETIKCGVREPMYDKSYLFDREWLVDINYNHGAHKAQPIGYVKYSEKAYTLCHYKYISPDFILQRTKYTYNRLSDLNKKMGWGVQWHQTEEQIKSNFEEQRKLATKVIE